MAYYTYYNYGQSALRPQRVCLIWPGESFAEKVTQSLGLEK